MFNLDLQFEEILEDIFSESCETNETLVKTFCDKILKE